jgi:hypothetical protein
MRYIDIHLLVITVLGVVIFGLGISSQLGVILTFIVAQFVMVSRNLIGNRKNFGKLAVNELLVILLCGSVFFVIRS